MFNVNTNRAQIARLLKGIGILDLLSANFEDRNPMNSQCRVPLSRHRKATPHYRYYATTPRLHGSPQKCTHTFCLKAVNRVHIV